MGDASSGTDRPPGVTAGSPLAWQPPRSRIDRESEQAALACVRRGRRDEALKILMTAYGVPLSAFVLRVVRDHELVKDVRQQVFLEAFQGIDRFEGRSSLWSWLCGIAYHRCLDELRRRRHSEAHEPFDTSEELAELVRSTTDLDSDVDRVARQRALEQCLGKLPVALRTQLLMRYFFGLSYAEIGETIGVAHSTVQVRLSRTLPQLRRCLRGEGVAR